MSPAGIRLAGRPRRLLAARLARRTMVSVCCPMPPRLERGPHWRWLGPVCPQRIGGLRGSQWAARFLLSRSRQESRPHPVQNPNSRPSNEAIFAMAQPLARCTAIVAQLKEVSSSSDYLFGGKSRQLWADLRHECECAILSDPGQVGGGGFPELTNST